MSKKIDIIKEQEVGKFNSLLAEINEAGELKISGHSYNKSNEEKLGELSEYEYFLKIKPDDKEQLILELLSEVFKEGKGVKEWFEDKKIPHEFGNYF